MQLNLVTSGEILDISNVGERTTCVGFAYVRELRLLARNRTNIQQTNHYKLP